MLNKLNNEKAIKVIGFAATAIGFAATLVSNWVGEKNMKSEIAEQVAKAIAEQKGE